MHQRCQARQQDKAQPGTAVEKVHQPPAQAKSVLVRNSVIEVG